MLVIFVDIKNKKKLKFDLEVLQKNIFGKRKCRLPVFPHFPTMFSKGILIRLFLGMGTSNRLLEYSIERPIID